jgi:hypothetical protein
LRSGELPAIKVGGRGQWRVEVDQLDAFIARMYEEAKAFVAATPYPSAVWKEEPPAGDKAPAQLRGCDVPGRWCATRAARR